MINRSQIRLPPVYCWVSTWMGDRLWVDKTSSYVTGHLGQLSLPSLRVGKSSTSLWWVIPYSKWHHVAVRWSVIKSSTLFNITFWIMIWVEITAVFLLIFCMPHLLPRVVIMTKDRKFQILQILEIGLCTILSYFVNFKMITKFLKNWKMQSDKLWQFVSGMKSERHLHVWKW